MDVTVSTGVLSTTAYSVVTVQGTPLQARISGGDRTVSYAFTFFFFAHSFFFELVYCSLLSFAPPIVVDASTSSDPDLMPGGFQYSWACTLGTSAVPCFDDNVTAAIAVWSTLPNLTLATSVLAAVATNQSVTRFSVHGCL